MARPPIPTAGAGDGPDAEPGAAPGAGPGARAADTDTDTDTDAGPLPFAVHPRLARPLAASRPLARGEPPVRRLRIFTSDPTASRLEGRTTVAEVPYEPLTLTEQGSGRQRHACLCGRLFELHMVDADGRALAPPALDDPVQLMQDGHAPSESNPRFHAQMVYAVASRLHADFRRALGREPGWGFPGPNERLRIYPLGSREANAWYDPQAGSLVFGYFEHGRGSKAQPGWASTALMHDIVAHELTHALLDSQRPHFMEPTGPDVLGFHEGFADLMALLQHFQHPEPLKAALRQSGGVLFARGPDEQPAHWLCRIARQFGVVDGSDALRRADRSAQQLHYEEGLEAHDMGELLLSAVFEAFDTVYRRRTARLRRLATGGSGLLPPGAMHPDLLDELAAEAASLARRFMAVTVRALDFCPPSSLQLGEYLRAMVTADALLVPEDGWGFREALIDAFRARRIFPRHVISLTEDALLWGPPRQQPPPLAALSFARTAFDAGPGRPLQPRHRLAQARALGRWLGEPGVLAECGLVAPGDPALKAAGAEVDPPCIDAVETTCHASPGGELRFHTLAIVTQRCRVPPRGRRPGFSFQAGGTLVFGPEGELELAIGKSALGEGRIRRRGDFLQAAAARARGGATDAVWVLQDNQLVLAPDWLRRYHLVQRARGPGGAAVPPAPAPPGMPPAAA